ncbi:ATP-binding protein [Paenibacillus doosanensis]|uniref:ATP-binding protein n=1 Tax=Paenibacillus doosanensis TaxID=1229154 RepID=UPI0021801E17|nr:ATP-binding protein [Paenibacillus doosanensis]MCS7462648.1 ATP-binding protein [Paenibacillus doosanensis]
MDVIKQLLFNMLIIITPVMAYHVFWAERNYSMNQSAKYRNIAVPAAVTALLCMVYPFQFANGFLYDFRFIPLSICILYAGLLPALGVAAVIIVYRFYLGGSPEALILSVVLIGLLILLVHLVKPYIIGRDRIRGTAAACIVGLITGIFSTVFSCAAFLLVGIPLNASFWMYFGLYSLLYACTFAFAVYVIEQMIINANKRNHNQQVDKMNVLSDLAASFAHEIRNPMTVARGFMQILKQPDISEDKRNLYTSMVVEEIDKAQSIVNDYLAFAKPQLEAIELVDAKALIQQALQSIEPYAKLCRVEVETELEDKMIISANKEKFVQCMVHLFKNGIEAMPGGGRLRIIGTVQSRSVCIDIIDHGVGMTPEEIRRLGTPFYSTRDKGTGLGMMVTFRVIQTIRGKIDVTSEVGKGTCFSLMIPTLHTTSYH